jgi:hypothetical protein
MLQCKLFEAIRLCEITVIVPHRDNINSSATTEARDSAAEVPQERSDPSRVDARGTQVTGTGGTS